VHGHVHGFTDHQAFPLATSYQPLMEDAILTGREEKLKERYPTFTSQFAAAALLAAILLIPAGCAGVQTTGSSPGAADSNDLVICPEPRPEVCTQEYRVVCAQMQDGSFKEYSNGCTSCSDPDVVGYRDGNCATEK